MLKVTNTSSKVVGFIGEDGENITVYPDKTVEVSDGLESTVATLEDTGLVKVERTGEAAAEAESTPTETAEEPEKTRRGRKKTTEVI